MKRPLVSRVLGRLRERKDPSAPALSAPRFGTGDHRLEAPIFVIGCQRSGTSLLRRILDSHSNIACPPESKFILPMTEVLRAPKYLVGFSGMGYERAEVAGALRSFLGSFFDAYASAQGKGRWADKTPNYVDCLPELWEVFGPEARFVHLIRHGMDVAFSLSDDHRHYPAIDEQTALAGGDRAIGAGRHWAIQNERMEAFRDERPEACFTLRYEELPGIPRRRSSRCSGFSVSRGESGVIDYASVPHHAGGGSGRPATLEHRAEQRQVHEVAPRRPGGCTACVPAHAGEARIRVRRSARALVGSSERRRPRVLVVGHGPPTTGGIPTYVARLATDGRLRSAVEVEFINTAPSGVKHPGSFSVSNLRSTATHAHRIFRGARRADVVHLNLAPVPVLPLLRGMVLATAARMAGSRVVMHAHTGRMEAEVLKPLYRTLLRSSRNLIDAFVVVSEQGARALRRAGIEPVLLENGVEPGEFAIGPKRSAPPMLLFVGTVCERKGLLDLRDALVLMREESGAALDVVIVGDGQQEGPGAFEGVRSAYSRSGLTDVEFTGSLPHERVRAVLAEASVFCLPSHWEACPLSVLEAMAAASAVVATSVGEIPVMLDGGRAGILVEPHDPPALAAALQRILANPGKRERLGAAARARIEQVYGWDRMVDRLFDLYRRLAAAGPRPVTRRRGRGSSGS